MRDIDDVPARGHRKNGPGTTSELGTLLKDWRALRGKSQLGLALDAEVSPRHLAFIESGRTTPSQYMVMRLAGALMLGLRERNALLVAAGFAPEFGESDWNSEEMKEIRQAAAMILRTHDPYPALVLDAASTVLDANTGALTLMGQGRDALRRINLMDLVFSPGRVRAAIGNWPEVAGFLLSRLRENARLRGPRSEVARVLERVLTCPEARALPATMPGGAGSVLVPLTFEVDGVTTQWFTTVTTFGAPLHALAEEITIEQFYPR
ncbi:helix-turn-helix transcriptional regulator [Myxococcus llanfairpwllgwyngyllgogerychwyrndrobwllllantysiliogogogochensis]|uniref:Helix-turn-helix transcriptional regulator n=1 Tax=Myxococcus llanfairpwllgwyngyllgogerychwyrndrobwllllantysiliogogogochensis TaxID=2590453 RepID=A0A540WHZ2_9BACT|nr:helix-turn-helix domain-containing protein [Myxococcus llanfairpwllgwyngyllgogerychwyrndrobwllllantysiliogogogochensis]TQF08639.1 helix-turn-helix transcriptional regulator [Myxococcus llanfairpwllgwyngyllgogerychwyrndrobwllllantysiliogogogochensis]